MLFGSCALLLRTFYEHQKSWRLLSLVYITLLLIYTNEMFFLPQLRLTVAIRFCSKTNTHFLYLHDLTQYWFLPQILATPPSDRKVFTVSAISRVFSHVVLWLQKWLQEVVGIITFPLNLWINHGILTWILCDQPVTWTLVHSQLHIHVCWMEEGT